MKIPMIITSLLFCAVSLQGMEHFYAAVQRARNAQATPALMEIDPQATHVRIVNNGPTIPNQPSKKRTRSPHS